MPEILTLTTPVQPPTQTTVKLISLLLQLEGQRVELIARRNTGELVIREERGAEALALMSTLNTANLPVKSLQRRALEYMASKGDFAGTVSGAPD